MSPAEKRLLMEVARQIRDDRKIEIDRLHSQLLELNCNQPFFKIVKEEIQNREEYLKDFDEAMERAEYEGQ
jgi:hypothetical protein